MNANSVDASVEVENLRRVFESKQNKVVALDGVSLQVRPGEIFGILGPNGAGKTTMIRILSTLLLPTSGSARVMGFDVAKEPEKVREVISMASGAERAGYDYISARGNLWFFSQLYGIPSVEAHGRIRELSKMLGLEENLDKKFYTLSTGYRQRVTIVRAFVNDPKVVFLDEPTIGLDVMTAKSIREFLVAQAKERGRTILLATHNMAEVDAICDRVAIIDGGKILASDTPSSLKRSLGAPALVIEVSPIPTPGGLELLTKIPGVKGFTSSIDEERGVSRVQVVVEGDSAAQQAISSVEANGLKVLSSYRQQTTLEEVFVALWDVVSERGSMSMRASLWLRTAYARMWVRTKSIYGEPLWVVVTIGFPLFTSMALSLLYKSSNAAQYTGFAILGGVMISFWGNVLWSMASQFMWDKQAGLFEVYITSPAPISAILVGMSLGGVLGTAPSAALVALIRWALFNPPISPSWPAVLVVFTLTLASLYALGMALSSLYLVYGREADSINEALHEPVSFLSGVYFPQQMLQFPAAVQIAASLIPLTIGMDALRRTLFSGEGLQQISFHIGVLALTAGVLLVLSQSMLKYLEERGRKAGTISVRIR